MYARAVLEAIFASIGLCGIEIAPCPGPAPRAARLQSDCVELKFAFTVGSVRVRNASIGLCGIEMSIGTGPRQQVIRLQSDCVELKCEVARFPR